MTQKAADDGAAQAILVRKLIAAHGSEAPFGDGLFPRRNIPVVLRIGVLNAADGGDAHAVEVGARFGGVTLKIAVQRAILLRNGELVPGPRKVVHTNVEIAGFEKLEQAHAEDLKFFHAFRKVRGEGALLLLQPRHVRIAEEGNAIRGESKNLIHGVGKCVCRLVGKAVNQIDVDAIEAEIASGEEQVARHFVGLNAVDGLLDFGLEVLNAHAETVETELAQRFEVGAGSDTRVNLDANLAIGVELKVFFRESEEILDLFGRQIGWRAAAPVELHDGTILRDAAADAFHLLLQHVEIRRGDALVFLNYDVARAEEAEAFTKGNVHIEGYWRPGTVGLFVNTFQIGGAEGVVPDGRCGIAGVARAGAIVFCEKFFADTQLAAHLIEAWMCECHAWRLLLHVRNGRYMLNQRMLASLDKQLGVLDRRVLQNSVAEVEDMTAAT